MQKCLHFAEQGLVSRLELFDSATQADERDNGQSHEIACLPAMRADGKEIGGVAR